MNTVVIFRRLVFTQVLLGIIAFCMAERNPGLLLVVGAIGAMAWYVTEGPRGKTIPRWLVNVGAIAAVAWLVIELTMHRAYVVAAMGHFTMTLQLLMLYARKTSREFSQLLVLSLLQMIAASVLSVSMIYGIFLGIYCIVALATVLLFHLTATADRVHQTNLDIATDGPLPIRPSTLATPGMRRQLRYFAISVGLVCGLVASAIFIAMPRTGTSTINFGNAGPKAPAQTGFSNTIRLGAGPIGTGSREPMLNLKIETYGQSIGWENDPWLVRGAALDSYNTENHTWFRSHFAIATDRITQVLMLNQQVELAHDGSRRTGQYTAEIALRDSRQRTIFSVVPVPLRFGSPSFYLTHFESDNLRDVAFSPLDQQLRTTESIVGSATYRLTWPASSRYAPPQKDPALPPVRGMPPGIDELSKDLLPGKLTRTQEGRRQYGNPLNALPDDQPEITRDNYARLWTVEPKRVRSLAMKIIRDAGLDRDPEARSTPDDLKIASALAEHLRATYRYDLANPRARRGEDPLIAFLFETRQGHCELFAAGLTALCRSVGIPARVITGFRASEFNTLGRYYVVRQSNAHAWTEVDGGPGVGWQTFDATPPDRVEAEHSTPDGLAATIREFYEHIEFAWIKSVVAFDRQTQKNVIDNVFASASSATRASQRTLGQLASRAASLPQQFRMGYLEIATLSLSVIGLLIAASIFVRLYLVRRRRVARLQLTALPPDQRRGLSRRLRFYLIMLDLLERKGYRRPAWQSPSSFARELAEANPLRFDPVVALTEQFYEIRFGHRPLDGARKKRIRAHLKQLEQSISSEST